ncbi:DUF3168 domain-containing protein [Rhizobium sp. L1K21]|uniref:DUF3168 domain-containing protein n=1 Tax=Rhizobium sp. L1K21 TaxID=2954933 RepID=UPI0020933A7F|nr:DUF3168 domain-containing protein [Rhizobium sp. L1K21]MCO6186690.1 DUF3168 domain-containing protein [Rhizobium sp. L1K21]
MSSAESALQQAVYAALASDGGLSAMIGADGVHDRQLTKTDMPYVLIREMTASDIGADGDGMQEILLTLEAWSAGAGHAEVQSIAGQVRAVLDDAGLVLADGFSLISLYHRKTRIRRETKTRLHVAEMTFRAVVA